MGKLDEVVNYQCDNCLEKFTVDSRKYVGPLLMFKAVILDSPYDLNSGTPKHCKYGYDLEIIIKISRNVGMREYAHSEDIILCEDCKKKVLEQIFIKEKE